MTPTTGTLSTLLEAFLSAFQLGRAEVAGMAIGLMSILVALELTIAGLYWALSGSEATASMIRKLLTIGFFIWLIESWDELILSAVSGFIYTGQTAAEAAGGRVIGVENPSAIVEAGFLVISPLLEEMKNLSLFGGPSAWIDAIINIIGCFIIFGAYLILAIQVFVTRLEFALVSTLGLILVPFAVLKQTSFISEKVLGAVISFGIKLMVLAFILAIAFPIVEQFKLPENAKWHDIFNMMAVALSIMGLSWHAPGMAASLLTGNPSLTAGGAFSSAVSGAAGLGAGLVGGKLGIKGGWGATKALGRLGVGTGKVVSYYAGAMKGSYSAEGSTAYNAASRTGSLVKSTAGKMASPIINPLKDAGSNIASSYQNGQGMKSNKSPTKPGNIQATKIKNSNLGKYTSKISPEEESPDVETAVPLRRKND